MLESHPERICTTSELYKALRHQTRIGALVGSSSKVRRAESAGAVLEGVLADRCQVALVSRADALRLVLQGRGSVGVCRDGDASLLHAGDDEQYAASLSASPPCRKVAILELDCQVTCPSASRRLLLVCVSPESPVECAR